VTPFGISRKHSRVAARRVQARGAGCRLFAPITFEFIQRLRYLHRGPFMASPPMQPHRFRLIFHPGRYHSTGLVNHCSALIAWQRHDPGICPSVISKMLSTGVLLLDNRLHSTVGCVPLRAIIPVGSAMVTVRAGECLRRCLRAKPLATSRHAARAHHRTGNKSDRAVGDIRQRLGKLRGRLPSCRSAPPKWISSAPRAPRRTCVCTIDLSHMNSPRRQLLGRNQ